MLPNLNDRRKLGLVAIFNRYKYIQVGIEAAEIEPWQSDTTVQTTETSALELSAIIGET
jgi:hypothetical protein